MFSVRFDCTWPVNLQLFLRANIGVDYVDFCNLLHVIASWRLQQLPHLNSSSVDDAQSDVSSTDNHLLYDLFRLDKILEEMMQPAVLEILDLGSSRLLGSPTNLHSQVHETVAEFCERLNCCLWSLNDPLDFCYSQACGLDLGASVWRPPWGIPTPRLGQN